MRVKIALILVIPILFSNCQNKSEMPKVELEKLISDLNQKSSISYDLDYKIKYFDFTDTTSISAKTIIIKEKSDSLFGGYIWYSRKDSIKDYIKYYDLNSFYIINNKHKEVIRYNPKKPIPYGFTNNFDGKLLKTYFLQDSSLKKLIQDSIYKSTVTDKNGLLKLKILYPDEDEIINQEKEITFDKLSNAVKQIIFRAELDSLQEYNEWNLSNIKFDYVKANDLDKKFRAITEDYKFIEYEAISKKDNLPLANGQEVEAFKGQYLAQSKSEFELANFKDHIIILDFWYRTCPPCIKSIPQLNNIYSNYKSKGVKVFGLNDIDTDSISKKLLVPFRHKENIKYPIVLIDKSVAKKYKVKGYPTLYVINKNQKVVYSKLGYSENLEREIDSVINKIIK